MATMQAEPGSAPAAPGGIESTVHQTGVFDHVFAPRADHGGPDLGISQLGPDGFLGLFCVRAPKMGGVFNFGFTVVDPNVNRSIRPALDNERIKSGALKLSSPIFTDFGFGDSTCQRRFRTHCVPCTASQRNACQRP